MPQVEKCPSDSLQMSPNIETFDTAIYITRDEVSGGGFNPDHDPLPVIDSPYTVEIHI